VLLGVKPFELRIAIESQKDVLQRIPAEWKDYVLNPASPRKISRVEHDGLGGSAKSLLRGGAPGSPKP